MRFFKRPIFIIAVVILIIILGGYFYFFSGHRRHFSFRRRHRHNEYYAGVGYGTDKGNWPSQGARGDQQKHNDAISS